MQMHSYTDVMAFLLRYLWRATWTRVAWPFVPKYTYFLDGLDPANGNCKGYS